MASVRYYEAEKSANRLDCFLRDSIGGVFGGDSFTIEKGVLTAQCQGQSYT